MLRFLENKQWFRGNQAIGLHVQWTNAGNRYIICLLEEEKGKVLLKESWQGDQLGEEQYTLLKSQAVLLSIDGKGVMHIPVEDANEETIPAVRRSLPNVPFNDFLVQRLNYEAKDWISLARSENVQQILADLEQHAILPIQISLGPFAVQQLANLTDIPSGRLDYALFEKQWTIEGSGVIEQQKTQEDHSEEQYLIGETSIKGIHLIPFLHALGFFGLRLPFVEDRPEVELVNRENFFQRRLFKMGGWAALGTLLVLLLVNFFLFDYYRSEVGQLESDLGRKEELLVKLDTMKKEVKQKESFFSQSGLSKAVRLSYKADRLAAEVPTTIQLQSMSINPLRKKRIKEDESPEFLLDEIFLEGVASQSMELNKWIKTLKSNDWVADVQIESYELAGKKGKGAFQIRISTI